MAVPPRLPKLAPEDMAWARWVTQRVTNADDKFDSIDTRIAASNKQRTGTTNAVASGNSNPSKNNPFLPQVPVGDPQKPTGPLLSSDHATVTIRWDGNVDVNGATTQPQQGFDYVTLQKSPDNQTWTTIGSKVGLAGTIVDVNVDVGSVYYYRFFTTDTLARTGPVSDVSSIKVVGVDLGSLDDDLQKNLNDLQHSATSGGLIQYSDTPPTDPAYHASTALWFDTSPADGAVPKRWDATSQTWVAVPYGSGALGEGSIVSSKILAGAIDTAALGANSVTANKIGAGAITTEKLSANAVVSNTIAAGAIDTNKLAAGAVDAKALNVTAAPAQASPTERVPRPMTDQSYWSAVISGAIYLLPGSTRAQLGCVATASGIQVTSPAQDAYMNVTSRNKVPASRQIHCSWINTGTINMQVRMYDGNQNQILSDNLVNNAIYTLNSAAVYYAVTVDQPVGGTALLSDMHVFEVIGGPQGSQQAAQLSPSGLRLFNDAGQLSVDITTNTTNFITILNGSNAVLTLDEDGNGNFNAVQANDDFYYQGDALVGAFADNARADGVLDGPILERMPWGVQYAAAFNSMNEVTVNTQYQRIASGAFNLDPNRTYQIDVDLGGLQTTNTSGVNVYVELQLSADQLQSVTDGSPVQRAVVYNGDHGYFTFSPTVFTSPDGAGLSLAARTLPGNTDIYWQINTNLSATPSGSYKFNQFGGNGALTIIDLGPSITVLDGTDRTTGGTTATGAAGSGQSGGGSSGTSGGGSSTTKTVTKTWTASWSGSWNSGGSNKVTGSGTYTDANSLYQGLGASNMGSKFGFPSSVQSTISSKTITKVEVFIQNRWTYYNAGGTASFKYHSNTSAGASYGSDAGSTFTRSFDRGQGRWLTISNSEVPYSAWKSGSARGLALIVEGSSSNYAYYDGVGKSKPPQLRITYK